MNERPNERDLVLPPNTYAHILDGTKGSVTCHVGPNQTSLGANDKPVIFDEKTKRFQNVRLEQAIKDFMTAPENWYVVLKNPTPGQLDGSDYEAKGMLAVGRKVNIPGPCNFPLQPGQMAKTVRGHHLKSNQYLVVRVYDEEAAKKSKGIVTIKEGDQQQEFKGVIPTMGKLEIIKGTDVSFYIPPTGIEVIGSGNNNYVHDAVTLERLEYCILLGENGKKRYVRGPEVVFPEPTEQFITKTEGESNNKKTLRKYRARELNEISGIHIKVTTDYTEGEGENTKHYKAGEELFITGKETPLYYPREEHAVIKYEGKSVHFATVIPSGEARYVMNRLTGKIRTEMGPKNLLPDPREDVLVRRVLDLKQVERWFPGNREAIEYNASLQALLKGEDEIVAGMAFAATSDNRGGGAVMDSMLLKSAPGAYTSTRHLASRSLAGDSFQRNNSYTKPRTITLDTKYEGAVTIDIWTGYAVNVVSKAGDRRTVVGPKTVILQYDEYLESIQLSTGMPKDEKRAKSEAYLRVLNNRVSDIVRAESEDLCKVNIELAYKVNFEGDESKWFNVENYVSHLCGHMRSVIKNCVKGKNIEDFYADSINILRNLILKSQGENGERPGYAFPENGMRICDVEVISVDIDDDEIESLLIESQNESVKQMLDLKKSKREKELTEETHTVRREIATIEEETAKMMHENRLAEAKRQHAIVLNSTTQNFATRLEEIKQELEQQGTLDQLSEAKLKREKLESDQSIEIEKAQLGIEKDRLSSEVQAFKDRFGAINDKFIAAIEASGNKELITKLTESMAPMSLLGGDSVVDIVKGVLANTPLAKTLDKFPQLDSKS